MHIYLTQEHKLQCFNTSCTHFSGNPVGRPACCIFSVVYFHVFSPLSGLLWRNCDGWSFCSEIYWCNGSPGKTSFSYPSYDIFQPVVQTVSKNHIQVNFQNRIISVGIALSVQYSYRLRLNE